MSGNCPRDGKRLDWTGDVLECRHCGYREVPTSHAQMTRGEVKELVRRVRLMSGSCKSRRHDQCQVSSCECWHHNPEARRRYAAALRREAAEIEHRASRCEDAAVVRDLAERAEELRRRADEVTPLVDEASHRCAYHECGEMVGPSRVYCEGHR